MSKEVIDKFREDVAGKLRDMTRRVAQMDGEGPDEIVLIRVNDMVDDLNEYIGERSLQEEETRSREIANRTVFAP